MTDNTVCVDEIEKESSTDEVSDVLGGRAGSSSASDQRVHIERRQGRDVRAANDADQQAMTVASGATY